MSIQAAILFFCLFGAVQGALLVVSLLSAGADGSGSRRVLTLYVLGGAVSMAVISLSHSGWVRALQVLQAIEYQTILVMAPLLYVYVRLATGSGRSQRGQAMRSFGLHFVPAAAWFVYLLVSWLRHEEPWWPPFLPTVGYLMAYSGLAGGVYWRANQRERGNAGRNTEGHFWIRALLGFMVVIHLAQGVRYAFRSVVGLENVVPLVGAIGFCTITVLGFRRSLLARASSKMSRRRDATEQERERSEREVTRVLQLLEGESRYLDSELSLTGLADELGVSRSFLSRLINERFGKSFLELIHDYRVREAQRLLIEPSASHLTVDAVARRSGFRSRSTFYEAFRRETGKTPSSYRRTRAS